MKGNFVGPVRVWNPRSSKPGPGLSMTRALGDFLGKEVGITSVPEVRKKKLRNHHRAIVLASDGVWEFTTMQEIAKIVEDEHGTKDPHSVCQKIANLATQKWAAVV